MKNIKQYIKNSIGYKLPYKFGFRTFEEFLDINNLTETNIDNDILEYYFNFNFNDIIERSESSYCFYINENLKTHNVKDLENKIYKELSNKINKCEYISDNPKNIDLLVITLDYENVFVSNINLKSNKLNNNEYSQNLYDIIQFYNYYITDITKTENNKGFYIYLEPYYTVDLFEKIKNNGNKVYHITKIENLEKIKNSGLRPKVGKTQKQDNENGYRYFPERIFLVGNNETLEKTIENIKSVIIDKKLKLGEYVIFEFDLKNHIINLWKDQASEGEFNIYTYTYLSKNLISGIYTNLNDIKNED